MPVHSVHGSVPLEAEGMASTLETNSHFGGLTAALPVPASSRKKMGFVGILPLVKAPSEIVIAFQPVRVGVLG